MKTIVDAVNDLRGDLGNWGCIFYDAIFTSRTHSHSDMTVCVDFEFETPCGCKVTFTDREFDQCVAELSEGLFVPLANKSSEPEIQYDSDGNGYQVGAIYEFSDSGKGWFVDRFQGLNKGHTYDKFLGDDCSWRFIRECAPTPIGKVHKKPAELINGAVYSFTCDGIDRIGYYDEADSNFYLDAHNFSAEHCTNITRLVPEKNQ